MALLRDLICIEVACRNLSDSVNIDCLRGLITRQTELPALT